MRRRVLYYSAGLICLLIIALWMQQGIRNSKTDTTSETAGQENLVLVHEENRAKYGGMQLYKGQLHSHTSISDGIKWPDDAYKFVKQHTDLDFYAVTEHELTFEISTGNDYLTEYQDSYSEDYRLLHEQSDEHNIDHEFVALPGVEVTWYDKAGHMNLFNTAWFPRTHAIGGSGNSWVEGGNLMYNLPTVYARLAQDSQAIAQFNHPSKSRHGNFFDFKHYTKEVDKNITLFEYRYSSNYPNIFDYFVQALDKGWHVSPAYSGDEHDGNWGNVGPYATGMWAEQLTRESIYDAMRNRRTYTSADRNFELAFSANGQMMGAILSADTKEIKIHIDLYDPDLHDRIETVVIYTNEKEMIKEYTNIGSHQFTVDDTLTCRDGDYFFIRVFQEDGDEIVSAPIWIGEVTRGTDFAPEITINGSLPERVQWGDAIAIPEAVAADDSGETPEVRLTVFNSKGMVEPLDNRLNIEEYGEYFIRYSATDSSGNTRVELKRIVVDEQHLNAGKILNEFIPVVNVGEREDQVGVNLVTDKVLEEAYVQYKEATMPSWDEARSVPATVSHFEATYGEYLAERHYRVLAAHEATLPDLQQGTIYHYRYGLSADGPWGNIYSFETAVQEDETVIYVLGDLAPSDERAEDMMRFNQMLDVLKQKNTNGRLMIQLGNFVEKASNIQPWTELYEHIIRSSNLISAHIVGELEPYTKKQRVGTWTGFYNLPKNGPDHVRETSYSFDYGDVHVAVIDSLENLNDQLVWLEEDLEATSKTWKVVMGHYPYYGGQNSSQSKMVTGRARLSELFDKHGVHLYIGGQDRIYKRSTIQGGVKSEDPNQGTTFITAGTTGTRFYENKTSHWDHIVYDEPLQVGIILQATDKELSVQSYNILVDEIDAFTIRMDE